MPRWCISILLVPALLISSVGSAVAKEFYFGVRPQDTLQRAQFGFRSGEISYFGGLDVLGIGAKATYTDEDIWQDFYDGIEHRSTNKVTMDGSATLLVPSVGARYSFGADDVRPYVQGSLFKALAFVRADAARVDREYENGVLVYEDVDDWELDSEGDALEKLLGFWGVSLGFGAEYMVSERFSVIGEYGVRFVRLSTDFSANDGGDPEDDYYDSWQGEISGTIRMSQVGIGLNFYF